MRYKKRIDLNELKAEYQPNSHISFNLPRAKIDLHSLSLYYTGNAANYANSRLGTNFRSIRRFFPRLSASIIQELTVKINKNNVVQHIEEYNMLFNILNDIHKEYDSIDSTSADTVQEFNVLSENILSGTTIVNRKGDIYNISKLNAINREAGENVKYRSASKKTFFIDSWLGFLGENNSRYLDCTNMDVQIIIKLAPPNILYRGFNSIDNTADANYTFTSQFDTDYVLTDIHATIDVLDDIPTTGDFMYKDYQYVQGTYQDSNKKSITSFKTNKPIEWVLSTFANKDRLKDTELQLMHANTDTVKFGALMKNSLANIADYNNKVPHALLYSYEVAKFQKDPYVLNSSIYMDRTGRGIQYCQYRLNSYLTPRQDVIACYNETKKCFNSEYKKVQSIYSFEENFFVNAIRLDDNSDELKSIDWVVEMDPQKNNNAGGTPMLFYSFMNKL